MLFNHVNGKYQCNIMRKYRAPIIVFVAVVINCAVYAFAQKENTVMKKDRTKTVLTTVNEARNWDDNELPIIGEKPYEMAGRKEERIPLVVFDDVTG